MRQPRTAMLDIHDERWRDRTGGYKVPYDCRPALARLEDPKSRAEAWEELWENLHHQGDIGSASLAAVPQLVRAYERFVVPDWNIYALVRAIEEIRLDRGIDLPDWLAQSYPRSLRALAARAGDDLTKTDDQVDVTSALGLIAFPKGLLVPGRLLLSYSVDELDEMEDLYRRS